MLSDYFIQRLSENLPYVPTEEQADLIARLSAFLWDDNVPSVFLLKGYAGTGKTSLIGALVKTLESFERTCVLLAPTGRAAKVFASYAGHAAYTIHKKIYRQRAFTGDFTGFQLAHNAHKNTFFIVDEASMIANETAEARLRVGVVARRSFRFCLFRERLPAYFARRYGPVASGRAGAESGSR